MKPQVPYGSSGTRLRPLSDTSPDRAPRGLSESAAGPAPSRLRLAAGRPAWVRAVVARTVVRKPVDRRALGVVGTDPEGRVTWVVEESRDPAASPLRLAVGRPAWLEAAA
jgi:hypothetical protein